MKKSTFCTLPVTPPGASQGHLEPSRGLPCIRSKPLKPPETIFMRRNPLLAVESLKQEHDFNGNPMSGRTFSAAGNEDRQLDFVIYAPAAYACLCLPLPASACLRVAFGLPPACSWPATGLLLNCFLGSLKPQASKCEATKSKRKDKGAAVHAAGVFDPPPPCLQGSVACWG